MSTIIILDTGISKESKRNNCIMTLAVEKDNVDEYFMMDDAEDFDGHGTMLYNLYNRLLPEEKYIVIRILKEEKIDERSIIFVLNYIYKNIECDIIAISSGIKSCVRRKELEEICLLLYKKRIMIIAAFDNIGGITYPAAFDFVIGVDFTSAVNSLKEYIWIMGSPVNYLGYCGNNILLNHKSEKINIRGNSFIVPYVVMQLVEYIKKGVRFENIFDKFKFDAKECLFFKDKLLHRMSFSIKKAIAFPCNKEMITLTKYACWLDFELQKLYDYKYSGNVSLKMEDIQGNRFIIEDEKEIDWNSDFDTVILGHCGIKNERIENVFKNLVEKAFLHQKKIFSFDGRFLNDINSANVYYPKITKEDIPYNNLGKLYMPAVPLIGVFGTGSKQGKFGTQLYLKKEFSKHGYKVGQIGTEPLSELFGFDEVYPVGYNSYNEIRGKEAIAALNEMVKRVEEKEVDVIIFGSQSYTLAYEYSQLEYFIDYQDIFLKALRPDIVVLCVSVDDEIDYIKKTIHYIETLGNSIVVGIVIAPINVKNSWRDLRGEEYEITEEEIKNFKKRVKCLEIPVYELKNAKDMSYLAGSCIDWLIR